MGRTRGTPDRGDEPTGRVPGRLGHGSVGKAHAARRSRVEVVDAEPAGRGVDRDSALPHDEGDVAAPRVDRDVDAVVRSVDQLRHRRGAHAEQVQPARTALRGAAGYDEVRASGDPRATLDVVGAGSAAGKARPVDEGDRKERAVLENRQQRLVRMASRLAKIRGPRDQVHVTVGRHDGGATLSGGRLRSAQDDDRGFQRDAVLQPRRPFQVVDVGEVEVRLASIHGFATYQVNGKTDGPHPQRQRGSVARFIEVSGAVRRQRGSVRTRAQYESDSAARFLVAGENFPEFTSASPARLLSDMQGPNWSRRGRAVSGPVTGQAMTSTKRPG